MVDCCCSHGIAGLHQLCCGNVVDVGWRFSVGCLPQLRSWHLVVIAWPVCFEFVPLCRARVLVKCDGGNIKPDRDRMRCWDVLECGRSNKLSGMRLLLGGHVFITGVGVVRQLHGWALLRRHGINLCILFGWQLLKQHRKHVQSVRDRDILVRPCRWMQKLFETRHDCADSSLF